MARVLLKWLWSAALSSVHASAVARNAEATARVCLGIIVRARQGPGQHAADCCLRPFPQIAGAWKNLNETSADGAV